LLRHHAIAIAIRSTVPTSWLLARWSSGAVARWRVCRPWPSARCAPSPHRASATAPLP